MDIKLKKGFKCPTAIITSVYHDALRAYSLANSILTYRLRKISNVSKNTDRLINMIKIFGTFTTRSLRDCALTEFLSYTGSLVWFKMMTTHYIKLG